MADIAYRSTSSVVNATSGLSTVIPVPAGVVAGDRMLAFVSSIGNSPTLTDPTGTTWIKLAEYAPGTTLKSAVYYRDVTAAAEPASYTWAWSASGRNLGFIVAYPGCDLTQAPIVAEATIDTLAAAAGVNSPAVTVAANDWLLTLVAGRENPGTDTAKVWTDADGADVKRLDLYTTNTGTGAKLTGAWWDSNRKMTAGSATRSVSSAVAMPNGHIWSVRLIASTTSSGGSGGGTTTPAATGADIGFVGKAYAFNSTSGNSTVVPVPTGVANGHRMFAMLGSIAASPTITDPAGWIKLGELAPGSTLKTALYYRDVTAAAEPASYTWGWSGNGRNWGYIVAYSGEDLTQAPTFDSVSFTDAAAAAGVVMASPALGLVAGDWLITMAGGRENPGTDTAKDFTNADTADVAELDFYSSNTGTSAKTVAAWWDSGRKLPAGGASRSISPTVAMQQVHLWSVRIASQSSGGDAGGGGGDGTTWSRMGLPRV